MARRAWRAWRRWRRSRPFWGGLLVLLAGLWIFATVRAPLPVVLKVGLQGFIGYLIPLILALLGLLLWFNREHRVFYSILAMMLTLASWLTSNLGGFLLGLILGLVGSSLAFAWAPRAEAVKPKHEATDDKAHDKADEKTDDTTDDRTADDLADEILDGEPR